MIPKFIIEKAIAGGWDDVDAAYVGGGDTGDVEVGAWKYNWRECALDPDFWMALGKEMGWSELPYHTKTGEEWGERTCNHCGINTDIQPSKASGCNHVHYPEACKVCSKNTADWEDFAHRFYDLILRKASQGEIDNFWKSL